MFSGQLLSRRPLSVHLLCHCLPVLIVVCSALAQTVSLQSDPELLEQSDCVRWCLLGGGVIHVYPAVYQVVGCAVGRAHSCLCFEQRRSAASSHVSSCITTEQKRQCVEADESVALSIYDRYCGFTPAMTSATSASRTSAPSAARAPSSPTAPSTRTVSSSPPPSPTVTVVATRSASLTSPTPSSESLLLLLVAVVAGASLFWAAA